MAYKNYWKHTFHNAVAAAADGADLYVEGRSTLLVWINGSVANSARQVSFKSVDEDGNVYSIMGVRTSDFATGTSTTNKGEEWQFDVAGKYAVRMDLDSMTGGTVTVKGRLE